MFLAVAASLSAGIRSPEPVKVLYRQSRVWDAVECAFRHPLSTAVLPRAEIAAATAAADGESQASTELPGDDADDCEFALTWKRTTRIAEELFQIYKSDEVLGSLVLKVPVATLRGLVLCAEVASSCSAAFVRSALGI
jgi:hypothetical protein